MWLRCSDGIEVVMLCGYIYVYVYIYIYLCVVKFGSEWQQRSWSRLITATPKWSVTKIFLAFPTFEVLLTRKLTSFSFFTRLSKHFFLRLHHGHTFLLSVSLLLLYNSSDSGCYFSELIFYYPWDTLLYFFFSL